MHLTNVAIQKTAAQYDDRLGGKWDLRSLKLYLMSKYGPERMSEATALIQDCIIRSLQSVAKTIINDKHCFELYGFDILLDDQLRPWLIEINASPSMTANTPTDYEGKINLLEDTYQVLDPEKVLKGDEEQIGGYDCIYRGGPIRPDPKATITSYLGCYNNRVTQLKKLAKCTAARLSQHYTAEQMAANTGNNAH